VSEDGQYSVEFTLNGCAPEFALWSFVDLGYLTYYTTYALATGAIKGEIGETFKAGRMGSYTIEKDGVRLLVMGTVKGGGLAWLAAPARLLTLILSDVVGDQLDVIASGPTAPDRSTFAGAWQILQRYQLLEQVPASVKDYLQRGLQNELPETAKTDDPAFSRVQNVIIGSNLQAAQAALTQAQQETGTESL
jgi:hypothetical protein